jgi:hypothetical protein
MSRGVQNFKQGDVTKAIKGAERAGPEGAARRNSCRWTYCPRLHRAG